MTYNLDHADKIIQHYHYLIGATLDNTLNSKIDYIVIAPIEKHQFSNFILAFRSSKNNKKSLLFSGYDQLHVQIILISLNKTNLYILELNKYLATNNINENIPKT